MDKIEAEKMARRRRTAEEISAALEKSGFSKKEFAFRMHRVPSEVTRWLSGKHNYTSDLLAEISLVLSEPISGADDRLDRSDLKGIVSGYGSSSVNGKLGDNVAGSIDIPKDIIAPLKNKARSRGVTLREYIIGLLVNDAGAKDASAMDFCGIWGEGYPDVDEIRSLRTRNSFPEL